MFDELIDETHRKPRKLRGTPAGRLITIIGLSVGAVILGSATLIYNSVIFQYSKTKVNPFMTSEELMYHDFHRHDFLMQSVLTRVHVNKKLKDDAALDAEAEE